MFTASGVLFTFDEGVLSIEDVAKHLSGIPRWANATRYPWSVLQHSLVMYELSLPQNFPGEMAAGRGRAIDEELTVRPWYAEQVRGPSLSLACLWHDAHEAVTEDVPPPFRPPELTAIQRELDVRIWRDTLGVEMPTDRDRAVIKWLDALCATAEATLVCHPNVRSYFPNPNLITSGLIQKYLPGLVYPEAFQHITRQLVEQINGG